MNDEQCEYLIRAINKLTQAISDGANNIVEAINAIYCSRNEGIERRLDKLIDAIDDIRCN
jgi:hypothetical protein